MFSLICALNSREAGDLRRHCAHHDVIIMHGSDCLTTRLIIYTASATLHGWSPGTNSLGWTDVCIHYSDVKLDVMASHIISLTMVYWTVYSGADQRRHQSSAPLGFVMGIIRWPVNSPHKWPVTRKVFPFDDVIMCLWDAEAPTLYEASFTDTYQLNQHRD